MRDIKACLSHNSDDWRTPKNIYDPISKLGFVDCFPFQSEYNELLNDYYEKKLFINPPYSKLDVVCDWVLRQLKNRNIVLLLIPSRTDTKYFHKLLASRPIIYMFSGRLKFNESNSAPFPSICLIWNTIPLVNFVLPLYEYGDSKCFIKYIKEFCDGSK